MTQPGPSVTLREITSANWEAVVALKLPDEQRTFVASNLYSLAESKFFPHMLPLAIYAGGRLVGFVMIGERPDPHDGQYWIYRLMIAANEQRHGYGRATMEQIVARMAALPDCREIVIGYDTENAAAARLYASLGFVETELASWGEQLAKLRLDPK